MGEWTPVFKKGDKQAKENYRPISVLPLLAKVNVAKCLSIYSVNNGLVPSYVADIFSVKSSKYRCGCCFICSSWEIFRSIFGIFLDILVGLTP